MPRLVSNSTLQQSASLLTSPTSAGTCSQSTRCRQEAETVTALAVSPDGKLLASGTKSLRLRFWSLEDGSNVRSLKAHDTPVVAMAFDATNTLLATGASDGGVRVWDARQGFVTHNFKGHTAVISCVRFHPDANRWTLFSAADSGEIRVWDLIGRNCTAVLSSHVSSVRSLDLSPDGYFLLSAGRDQVLSLWNLRKNALEKTVPVFETLEAAYFVPPPRLAVKRKKDVAQAADSKSASSLVAATAGEKGTVPVRGPARTYVRETRLSHHHLPYCRGPGPFCRSAARVGPG